MRKPFLPVVLVLLVLIGFGVTLSAQSPTLQMVQNTLNGLVTTVNSLVTAVSGVASTVNAVNAAVTPGNVLITPPLKTTAGTGQALICNVVNISTSLRDIYISLVDPTSSVPLFSAHYPTAQFGIEVGLPGGSVPNAFCVVFVANGTKNDVRAVLGVTDGAGSNTFKVAVAAQ